MILIDFSYISRTSIHSAWKTYKEYALNYGVVYRVSVLEKLNEFLNEHHKMKYEKVVIAIDSKFNWRKNYYSRYKSSRKKKRDESDIDWKLVFEEERKFIEELIENFCFHVIAVDGAEGDDIVGCLTLHHKDRERVLILGIDKDFFQLQIYPSVSQCKYNNECLHCDDPEVFKEVMIMLGDRADDIPNAITSDQDVILKTKKPRFGEKTIREILKSDLKFIEEIKKTEPYKRNQLLIDLEKIPEHIQDSIIQNFLSYKKRGSRVKIANYLRQLKTSKSYLYMAEALSVSERIEPGEKTLFQQYKDQILENIT